MKETWQEFIWRQIGTLQHDIKYTIPNIIAHFTAKFHFAPAKNYLLKQDIEQEKRMARIRDYWITVTFEPIPKINFDTLHNMSEAEFNAIMNEYITSHLEMSKNSAVSKLLCTKNLPQFIREQI